MNIFKEMFPLARMFPLAVMQRVFCEFSGAYYTDKAYVLKAKYFLINKCDFLIIFLWYTLFNYFKIFMYIYTHTRIYICIYGSPFHLAKAQSL